MISKKTKYALKALGYLARKSGSGPVLISELAQAENIPKKFLEAILLTLRKGDILKSRIGKGGGYSLASPPSDITIGQVIRILEGGFSPVTCLNESKVNRCDYGNDPAVCGIRLVMTDLKQAMAAVLDDTTLEAMIERGLIAQQCKEQVIDYMI